jgi:hypothetical protein
VIRAGRLGVARFVLSEKPASEYPSTHAALLREVQQLRETRARLQLLNRGLVRRVRELELQIEGGVQLRQSMNEVSPKRVRR